MNIIMVGGGNTLYFLSRSLASEGHSISIVNKDKSECDYLARRLEVTVVFGEASDPSVLEDAGAHSADIVMALTSNDDDNLVICQMAQLNFEVPRVFALINDPDNDEIFRKLGIAVFSFTWLVANLVQERIPLEEVTKRISIGEGKLGISEVELKDDSPVSGKAVKDIDIEDDFLIAAIYRKDVPIVPKGDTVLKSGDTLAVVSLPEVHQAVIAQLTESKRD
jgi:trk system potassium uptake protein